MSVNLLRLNISLLHVLKSSSCGRVFEGGTFGKLSGHKGESLVNEISALIRGRGLLSFTPIKTKEAGHLYLDQGVHQNQSFCTPTLNV